MRKFLIKHSKYDFYGKTKYLLFEVMAKSCLHAVALFRIIPHEHKNAVIEGVRSYQSLTWKTDHTLLDPLLSFKAAIKTGLISEKRE